MERMRNWGKWADELKKANINNCSVAILAVGQYLASDRSGNLWIALDPWISDTDFSNEMWWYVSMFGEVIGPVVQLALNGTDELDELPKWAGEVGDEWCKRFLKAGAHELRSDEQPVAAHSYA
ncbi:hypothetical protein MMEU_1357 [Mycobacterium marinum str. Europe]|nr:hypothetical protein MMEU_1357 [Mycobacterium marinum str. Europe]